MGEGWSRGIRIVLLVLSGALVLGGLYWKGREILGSDPSYNFDVLGYVACALALDGLDRASPTQGLTGGGGRARCPG